ncbi:aspartate/glutamate racemase family protein [Streptomyces sp. ME02-8801-2C]|uniref:aspartate/glutamate racemase family protein n=1 Tax=Streptomyces sp. ME02-8801-2C TaxID=3028680 RepID=UPI0029B43E54|nr:aspartate/glutamate racemase family protein [Streptomyces sp. ME02-8801-2C]MDX3451892.1 aspartate/glutamate racemase family protein [Streptomyces sp. ME02-8801-2C]
MLALLHTSPLHIPVFDALRDEDHPGLELAHLVHEDLLARARAEGPDAVSDDVRAVLDQAVAAGAAAVLCTCSSIGGVAEAAAEEVGVPVLRVDRPMAAAAVAIGPKVVVVATSESTFGPTVALVEEEARHAGLPVDVRQRFVEGAWALFQEGDMDGYVRSVADAVDSLPGDKTDAIILAQASMSPAQLLTTTAVPVLSSPRPGLAAGATATRTAT